ncbi:hypothetical protein K6025_05015 [Ehrlichia sp. JZT12]
MTDHFYNKLHELFQNYTTYYPYLEAHEKRLVMFPHTICVILQNPCLVESAKLAPIIVPEIEEQVDNIINLSFSIHNYFILNNKQDLKQETQFFAQISNKVNSYAIKLYLLCDQLLYTSDFINKNYIHVAACINSLKFFIDKIIHNISCNITSYKTKEDLLCTTSIKRNIVVDINPNTFRKEININDYIDLLKDHYNNTNKVYQKFLLKEMEAKYHCSFDDLLLCLANESLKPTTKESFITGAPQVSLLNKTPEVFYFPIIKISSIRNQVHNCVTNTNNIVSPVRKKTNSRVEKKKDTCIISSSISIILAQHSYSKPPNSSSIIQIQKCKQTSR